MMAARDQKPWRARRSEFPWLVEREALQAERRERKRKGKVELDIYGQPKMSSVAPVDEVIKYAYAARNQPEIWGAIQQIVERSQTDSETELTADENFFLIEFCDWYLLKLDLPYRGTPFWAVHALLLRIANGWIVDDLGSNEVRDFLLADPAIVGHSNL